MSESDKENQKLNPDLTTKMSFDPANVELTQKMDVDYEKIIDESKKGVLISGIRSKDNAKPSV